MRCIISHIPTRLLMRGPGRPLGLTIARLLARMIQTEEGLVVLHSRPDFSGNAKALYFYLRQQHPTIRCAWIVERIESLERLREQGIRTTLRGSLSALLVLARAEIVVTTHTYPLLEAMSRAMVVNLWHGLSLKGIGATQKNAFPSHLQDLESFGRRTTLCIASSDLSRDLVAASRMIDPRKIEVTGYPRNDWLFSASSRKNLEQAACLSLHNRTALLYAPTYRDQPRGKDQREPAMNRILRELLTPELRSALQERNAVLVVKLHPYDEGRLPLLDYAFQPPFHLLTGQDLAHAGLDLYEVLGGVDILITDYSSIAMDFLLLNRPIIFYVPDAEDFTKARGMKLEPIDFWMPGPKAMDAAQLISALDLVGAEPDRYAGARAAVRDAFYQQLDDGSARRVWEAIERRRRRRSGRSGPEPEDMLTPRGRRQPTPGTPHP